LSADDAAAVVGIEVGALKSRLHRARLQLRSELAALLGDGDTGGPPPCSELARELTDYVANEIDQPHCVRIEEHLGQCPLCASACDLLKRTVSLCRRIPGDEVPAPVRSAVRQAIRSLVLPQRLPTTQPALDPFTEAEPDQHGRHDRQRRVPLLRSTHHGADVIVGIRAEYLVDAVAGGGVQTLRFGEPIDPVVVEHVDGRLAVVMPIRM
jgi:hypothetical protein